MSLLSDYFEWKARLADAVDDTLTQRVAPAVKNEMQVQVHEAVYDAWEPRFNRRRGDNGGLSDTANITDEVTREGDTHVLTVRNMTQTQSPGYDLTPIVAEGNSKFNMPFPRPFVNETERAVKASSVVDKELAAGLQERGFTVK